MSRTKAIRTSPRGTEMTYAEAASYLHYEPLTGIFVWKVSPGYWAAVGDIAGGDRAGGYSWVRVLGHNFSAHRLAWYMSTGDLPPNVDHENGILHDNRLSNLRAATTRQNRANSVVRRDSKSGIKGVRRERGSDRWIAQIKVDGKRRRIGSFVTPEEASAAYLAECIKAFGSFARAS